MLDCEQSLVWTEDEWDMCSKFGLHLTIIIKQALSCLVQKPIVTVWIRAASQQDLEDP